MAATRALGGAPVLAAVLAAVITAVLTAGVVAALAACSAGSGGGLGGGSGGGSDTGLGGGSGGRSGGRSGNSAAAAGAGHATARADPRLAAAVAAYRAYVVNEADALLAGTTDFVAAVKAGDVAKAKALYPTSRTHWERIEPVAESFADLDPAVDARENDVQAGQEWTGFHRLEKDLWTSGDVSKDAAIADRLLADVTEIVTRSKTVELSPIHLATGSKELLDEVATGKITGEEDRYSHTDLWDFAANVDGSRAAIDALRDALIARDAALAGDLDTKFAVVQALLDKYRVGTGWRLYTDLSHTDLKALADAINALAEPISKVAAVVAG